MSGSLRWTREHKIVEFAAKIRISYRNRCFNVPIKFLRRAQVARTSWLELCGARRHFVPSRTRSKAPNLRGEQSRVMCMYQEIAQKQKTSSRESVPCDSSHSGTHPSLQARLTCHDGHFHAQLGHVFDAHAPPFAIRRAFRFAVFHSFSVELPTGTNWAVNPVRARTPPRPSTMCSDERPA